MGIDDAVVRVVAVRRRIDASGQVIAPTLLIVGGDDTRVIELNREAAGRMPAGPRLEIVPGAGHLFEEPGALEQVAQLARDWLARHVPCAGASR